jgi:F-type H+-transporting ATPase subunit delta
MNESKINVRYAKAFFALSKEKGLTRELRADGALIASVCESNADFRLLLESPVIKTSQKAGVIKQIFKGKVHPLSVDFLLLIINNKRESFIPGILRNLEDLYRLDEGIKAAVFTSAQPIDDENIILKINQTLEEEFDAKIELSRKVNKKLIGGFILRVEGQQYDASISTQLKKIKEQLLHTELK